MIVFQMIRFALFDVKMYGVMVYYLKVSERGIDSWVEVGGEF